MTSPIQRVWQVVYAGQSPYRRHAAVTSVISVAIYSTGIVTGPLLARALGPSGRGDYAAVVAPATVVVWLIAFGMPTSAAYHSDRIPEAKVLSSVTMFGIVIGLPAGAALWVLAPRYFAGHPPTTVTWARLYLLVLPFMVGMSAALEIRRRRSPDMGWNLWRAAPLVVPAVATAGLAITGRLTLTSALGASFAGSVLPAFLLVGRLRPIRSKFRPDLTTLRTIFPYAARASVVAASTSVTSRLDQVVLVALVAPSQLGLYAVAVTVASVTNPLSSGLALAMFGHLRPEDGSARTTTRVRRTVLATALVSAVVGTLLAILAPLLLRVGFGGRFEAAATPLRLLLPGAVAFDVLAVLGTKLYSDGRPGEASLAGLVGAGVTLLGLAAAAPRFGINGAAAVTSCAFVVEVIFLIARGALRPSLGLDSELPRAEGPSAERDR